MTAQSGIGHFLLNLLEQELPNPLLPCLRSAGRSPLKSDDGREVARQLCSGDPAGVRWR